MNKTTKETTHIEYEEQMLLDASELINGAYNLLSKVDDWGFKTIHENRDEKSYALSSLNDTGRKITNVISGTN